MNTLSRAGVFLSQVGCKLLPMLQHHCWGHMALIAQCTLRVAQMQPEQLDLSTELSAALLEPVNASMGKIMPYHKVAMKTGLSLDSPSENPAPQPGRQLLSGVCRSSVPAHSRGIGKLSGSWPLGDSLETACSNTRRAVSWRCWKTAAEPLSLDGCWFSSPGGWKLSRVHRRPLHPHLRCAAAVPDGSEALKELLGAELLWKTGCAPGCRVLLQKHWLRVYD